MEDENDRDDDGGAADNDIGLVGSEFGGDDQRFKIGRAHV